MTFDGMTGWEAICNCGPLILGGLVFLVVTIIVLKRAGLIDRL